MTDRYYKNSLKKYGFLSKGKVEQLFDTVRLYTKELRKMKLRISDDLELSINKHQDKGWLLNISESTYYKFLNESLFERGWESKALLKTYIRTIVPFLNSKNLGVSIDPKPENFVILEDGSLVYCDYLPPLLNSQSAWMLFRHDEWDQDISWKMNRYFTSRGFFINFMVRLLKISPQNGVTIAKTVQAELQNAEISSDLVDIFQWLNQYIESPNTALIQQKSFLEKVDIVDRDLMRLLFLLSVPVKGQHVNGRIADFFIASKHPQTFNQARMQVITEISGLLK